MAMALSDMPEDIIINILSRLPVESLMRFRCVCRSWHALFTDPNFIDMHLNQTRANNDGHVLIQHRDADFGKHRVSLHCDETFFEHKRLELPSEKSFGSFMVEGHCNGLLCLSTPYCIWSERDIYLWNPAIQKLKALPESIPRNEDFAFMYLAFGFAPLINDYRLVKFLYDRHDPDEISVGWGRSPHWSLRLQVPPQVAIYSLRKDSWKQIQNVVPCEISESSIDAILNGVVHWVAGMETEENRNYEFILSFDMAYEVFGEIKLPECCHDDFLLDMFVMVLTESLSLFVYCKDEEKECVDIWVLKEYGAEDSWTKQFVFDWSFSFLFPLGFMKNGEVVLKGDHGVLVLYDSRVQQVVDLHIHQFPKSVFVFTYYMESLVLRNE